MGLFTYQEALRARDMSRAEVAAALAAGEIRRMLRGVYADASEPDTLELRAAAIRKMRPPGSIIVVYLRTAAWLHGLDVLPPGRSIADWPLQLAVPSRADPPRIRGIKGYEAALGACDTTELFGIRVTTAFRTSLDCARLLPWLDAQAAVDQFVRREPAMLPALREEAMHFAGQRGVRQLRSVVELSDCRVESPGESWSRVVLVNGGLPIPEPQIEIVDDSGRAWARIDNGYRSCRVGVEYDGLAHHESAADSAHDEARREQLDRVGWRIIVACREHIWRDTAELVTATWNSMLERGYVPDQDPPSELAIKRRSLKLMRGWRGSEYLR